MLAPSGEGLILYQAYGNLYAMRALGWHLEEIHVTWAYLEKKGIRLRLYTKNLKNCALRAWRRRRNHKATASGLSADATRFEDTRLLVIVSLKKMQQTKVRVMVSDHVIILKQQVVAICLVYQNQQQQQIKEAVLDMVSECGNGICYEKETLIFRDYILFPYYCLFKFVLPEENLMVLRGWLVLPEGFSTARTLRCFRCLVTATILSVPQGVLGYLALMDESRRAALNSLRLPGEELDSFPFEEPDTDRSAIVLVSNRKHCMKLVTPICVTVEVLLDMLGRDDKIGFSMFSRKLDYLSSKALKHYFTANFHTIFIHAWKG
ncbi:hypothetical protein Tco_0588715 [Tanacetum coccineum]